MTEKKTDETEDPVLSRIGKFGRFQARVSPTSQIALLCPFYICYDIAN